MFSPPVWFIIFANMSLLIKKYKIFWPSFGEILKDSGKDMKNNYEGVVYGLQNPDKSCRIWLNDLDINTNTWRNK